MKKWAVIIMLFITSAGTFFPCCLIDDCCVDKSGSTSHNENQQKEKGNCSPFFACAACAAFVELAKPIQLTEPVFQKAVHPEKMFSSILSGYFHSFWQPPRLV
jgi:hypothetical protein